MTKQSFLEQAVLAMLGNIHYNREGFQPEDYWSEADRVWKAKENKGSDPEKKREGFIPPTMMEVQAYINKMGYKSFTAASWINHYESKGWFIGKNKMKDWKAAVRTWGSKESGGAGKKKAGFV